MPASSKGIFVTTGRYTKDAREFAQADPARPILLLDGRNIVQLCIDHRLGFRSRPVFDPSRLRGQLRGASSRPSALPPQSVHGLRVMRTITANDIRARIIRVPAEIAAEMDTSDGRLSVAFPPTVERRDYAYRSDARFIAGVTDVLRACGLLLQDGESAPKLCEWVLNRETREVDVYMRHGIAPEGGSA
jgi:restriction system protein